MIKQYLPSLTAKLVFLAASVVLSLLVYFQCFYSTDIRPVKNAYRNVNGVLYPIRFLDDAELCQRARRAVNNYGTKVGSSDYSYVACRVPLGEIRGSALLDKGTIALLSEDASLAIFDPLARTVLLYPGAASRSALSLVTQPDQYVRCLEQTGPGQLVAYRGCYQSAARGSRQMSEAYRLTLDEQMQMRKQCMPENSLAALSMSEKDYANKKGNLARDGRYVVVVSGLDVKVIDCRTAKVVAQLAAERFSKNMYRPESIRTVWLPNKDGQSLIVYGTMVGSLEAINLR